MFREEPGQVRGVEHHSHTPPGTVIHEQWIPAPHHLHAAVQQEFKKMYEQGIIAPSKSLWLNPLLTIPKPDGRLSLCIGFRSVNNIATFDAFPMPHIEELLERTGQDHCIITLDLSHGYWQIPMAKEDQAKSAFGTPWSLFEFHRMPFWLHGAATIFIS